MKDNMAQSTIDSEDKGDLKSPQLGEQPEQVKSLTVEEAYRRGVIDATGGFAIPNLMNSQRSRNTAFKKYAIKFFNTKIRERRKRLLGNAVNDLATSNLTCNSGVTNPQKIAQEANRARISELKQLEPPEQYEEYAKLMGSEHCNICGFNALEFRHHIQERIKALTADKEQ